jgi:hypothetical protein
MRAETSFPHPGIGPIVSESFFQHSPFTSSGQGAAAFVLARRFDGNNEARQNSLANNALTDSFSHGAMGLNPGCRQKHDATNDVREKGRQCGRLWSLSPLLICAAAAAACIFSASLVWI